MKILEHAIQTAQKAGELLLKTAETELEITEKAENDFVTNADQASEKLIIEEINAKFPKHAIIAEENSLGQEDMLSKFLKANYIWIIDPLDGTLNYSRKIPAYAVSIGVFKTGKVESSSNFEYLSGELVAGVVYAPKLGELFAAEKGKGATLNGKPIHVSNQKTLRESVTATGFPAIEKERNLPYFSSILKNAGAVRRLGAASLDLCYVAAGRFDGFWEFGLKPWDIAAGALIVEEAGGKVTDIYNDTLDLFGGDILASNGLIHADITKVFGAL